LYMCAPNPRQINAIIQRPFFSMNFVSQLLIWGAAPGVKMLKPSGNIQGNIASEANVSKHSVRVV
jgi:hypothetical protein